MHKRLTKGLEDTDVKSNNNTTSHRSSAEVGSKDIYLFSCEHVFLAKVFYPLGLLRVETQHSYFKKREIGEKSVYDIIRCCNLKPLFGTGKLKMTKKHVFDNNSSNAKPTRKLNK